MANRRPASPNKPNNFLVKIAYILSDYKMDRAAPTPMYSGNISPAYQLRYSWTGWASGKSHFPDTPSSTLFKSLQTKWEADSIRLLEHTWSPQKIQLTVSTSPEVAPDFCAQRLKGRLQYELRQQGTPVSFSRKFSIRSVGDVTTETVEAYIAKQIPKEKFADHRFAERLQQWNFQDKSVDLTEGERSNSARYFVNYHLVLVTDARVELTNTSMERLYLGIFKIAKKKVSRLHLWHSLFRQLQQHLKHSHALTAH